MVATTLDSYVAQCTQLSQDLRILVQDLEAQVDAPGSVIYSVDYSEIYAYLFDDKLHEHFRMFDNQPEREVILQEEFVLQKIFGERRECGPYLTAWPVILLDPYASELADVVPYIGRYSATIFAQQYLEANIELERMLLQPQFADIVDKVSQIPRGDPDNGNLTEYASATEANGTEDPSVARMLDFFEREAPKLVMLLLRAGPDPAQKLQTLLDSRRFRDMREMLDIKDLEIDQEVVATWESNLQRLRKNDHSQSSYLDGVAVATLMALNERLKDSGKKVVLLTRSAFMHRLMRREMSALSVRRGDAGLLRHPRCLIPLHVVEGQVPSVQLDQLKDLLNSVEIFVSTYRNPPQSGSPDDYEVDMEAIRSRVRASAGLSSWLTTARTAATGVSFGGGALERLNVLVDATTSQTVLNRMIVDRIANLEQELERLHRLMGVAVYGARIESAGADRNALNAELLRDRIVVSSPQPVFLYSLHFESTVVKTWWQRLITDQDISVSEVLDLLRISVDSDSDYEVLLFIAYVFGSWQSWELAARYCEFAIAKHQKGDASPHEAHFFLAVCRRWQYPATPQHFQYALDSIEKATVLKAQLREENYKDPRHIKEKSVILLLWHEAIDSKVAAFAGSAPPYSMQHARQLAIDALELISSDDHWLMAQVLNNLGYHYCERFLKSQSEVDRVEAMRYLTELESLLREIEPDETLWPPSMLDTVIWSRFQLRTDEDTFDFQNALLMLSHVRSHPSVPRVSKEAVGHHITAIRAAQATEIPSAP